MADQPSNKVAAADKEVLAARIQAGVTSDVPKIYVNGFVNGLTSGDVLCVLERNGLPAAVLNMSFTVAKSFAQSVGSIVSDIETKSGREMLTTKDIESLQQQQIGEGKK